MPTEEVYMNPTFEDFVRTVVLKQRSGGGPEEVKFDAVKMHVNGMDISFPHQLFINGEFVDSVSNRKYPTINPFDESVICQVGKASKEDVNKAVMAAKVSQNRTFLKFIFIIKCFSKLSKKVNGEK